MNRKSGHPGKFHAFSRRAILVLALAAASLWIAPVAIARTHVGFGVSIGVGSCWNCGYWTAPPVYYAPAYPPPAYYPRTVYYAPRPPVYYGYGYSGYYPPYHHYRNDYRYRRGDYGRGNWHHRHHRGHYYHGHR
jgi:hypothetical protein